MNELQYIETLRARYIEERAIFVPGSEMVPLLRFLGATESDFTKIEQIGGNLSVDPTLPFRMSRNGRFSFAYDRNVITRLEPQPFVLTAAEDFVRHDSGKLRNFGDIDVFQDNTVLAALLRFNAHIVRGVEVKRRPGLDYEMLASVCTVFALRTVTSPRLVGEPALEGVHTDGVDHTMTTMVATDNISDDSAITYMHDMREQSGARWNETDPGYRLGSVHHRHFLDTLVVVDNERKHSVTPVTAVDKQRDASRDMLIFFTRKPAQQDHVSFEFDSLSAHGSRPLEVEMICASAAQ